jgi:hypothetical protein
MFPEDKIDESCPDVGCILIQNAKTDNGACSNEQENLTTISQNVSLVKNNILVYVYLK